MAGEDVRRGGGKRGEEITKMDGERGLEEGRKAGSKGVAAQARTTGSAAVTPLAQPHPALKRQARMARIPAVTVVA
jgi:hypothetical protein